MKDIFIGLSLLWLIPFSIATMINVDQLLRDVHKLKKDVHRLKKK